MFFVGFGYNLGAVCHGARTVFLFVICNHFFIFLSNMNIQYQKEIHE